MKGLLFSIFILTAVLGSSQDPTELPLFSIEQLQYKGGFRLPASTFGVSSLNYSQGPIEYNKDNHSLYIVSHTYQQAIAEFAIPEMIATDVLSELNMAGNPIQNFSSVLGRAETGNVDNIDRIGGMEYIDHTLIVNGYQYYDAGGNVTVSTIMVDDSDDLENATVKGFYSYDARAGNTSGWISPIPEEWQSILSGTHITGQSSGIPIISRTSVGPTAYSFDAGIFSGEIENPVETSQLLDFSYPNGIHEDLSNSEGENDKWTHLSQATYGFIVPGTRTYLTIGKSGGHESGVCYKCTQDNGNLCGGYCTPVAADNYQYYWLWDMNDLIEVMNGERVAYDVQPYDYGQFNTPFQNGFKVIGGGSYDPESNILYLSINGADREQGTYSNPPVIVAYEPVQSAVVPVEWLSFDVLIKDEIPVLSWSVGHEKDTEVFEIERKSTLDYETIGNVLGSQSGSYQFQDRNAPNGQLEYRIKQVDFNGDYSYSETRVIDLRQSSTIFVSPNPVDDILTIHSKEPVFARLISVSGAELFHNTTNQIDLSDYASGLYLLIINGQHYKILKN
ncbi:T9SS type A sorting domain-containing protein [Portibacter lacus]|uniref:Secretion system C-terminal sorting domain-containing protein n=1 Tax=Portibacter lacus TaxID=1099794 RepID=A0AA37SPA3_9BACT|nr:T9SS type A sorting domain-containing protein [Portibacter lacus]GLR16386.1 hypothetical protein GCM10007940_10010 [Portibacter lacus]